MPFLEPRARSKGDARWVLAAIALGVAALSPAAATGETSPTVIVLSWDGTRADYPERTPLPALERLAREGTRASLVPVFPASTFPNHVSLATGTYVDRHGIVGNVFEDPKRGLYKYSADAEFLEAEPIWIAAERQGVRAASFFWVGSETPWRGHAATYRKTPFDEDVGEAAKVDQILAWLDLPVAERPQLILSWWHGADSVGHRNGADTEKIAEQLRLQDEQLARLLAGLDERQLWNSTTLLIVSDHGMTTTSVMIDPLGVLEDAGIAAKLHGGGGFGYVKLEHQNQVDAALEALEDVDGLTAHRSADLPSALRARFPSRTGDITVIVEPPGAIRYGRTLLESAQLWLAELLDVELGAHGYLPSHADMRAIFYAAGRGVDPTRDASSVRAIDVAPTIAALLGIDPPSSAEGQPIAGIGVPNASH